MGDLGTGAKKNLDNAPDARRERRDDSSDQPEPG